MGAGFGMSHSEFLKIEAKMKEKREYSFSHPAYLEGFQTPSLAKPASKIESDEGKYPSELFKTVGKAFSEYLKPQIKTCHAQEVRFSVKAGQSLLQGKVTKSRYPVQIDKVVIELQGRSNEQAMAVDSMEFENGSNLFNRNKFHLTGTGIGFCLVNEDGSGINVPNKAMSHSSEGSDLRLLNHMLYIAASLKDDTARVEVAPIIK